MLVTMTFCCVYVPFWSWKWGLFFKGNNLSCLCVLPFGWTPGIISRYVSLPLYLCACGGVLKCANNTQETLSHWKTITIQFHMFFFPRTDMFPWHWKMSIVDDLVKLLPFLSSRKCGEANEFFKNCLSEISPQQSSLSARTYDSHPAENCVHVRFPLDPSAEPSREWGNFWLYTYWFKCGCGNSFG